MALANELRLVLLLVAVWLTERGCKRLHVSPIIGQILAGLVVGPALLDVIPFVDAFRLLGKIGVMILVVESGLVVDLSEVRRCGSRASLAAITGVILPTLLSFALYSWILGENWETALAVGAAISPTSLGFSAQMLSEAGELTTPGGQLICTAAVVDDVFSLLLLAEVQALGQEDAEWYVYVVPVVASAGSILVGMLATIFISSRTRQLERWLWSLNDNPGDLVERHLEPGTTIETSDDARAVPAPGGNEGMRADAFNMVPLGEEGKGVGGTQARPVVQVFPVEVARGDRVLLAMVLGLSLLLAYLSALVGSSDLLGCFLGGLAFSSVPSVRHVWQRQMKRYTQWGARLFFACAIGFSVPSIHNRGGLLRPRPLWKGLVLTFAAVVGKLAVGFFAVPPLTLLTFLKLGWAMNGRGEFSFFIAQEASDEGILMAEDYSAVVWALLLSSVAAPIMFGKTLAASRRLAAETVASSNSDDDGRQGEESETGVLAAG